MRKLLPLLFLLTLVGCEEDLPIPPTSVQHARWTKIEYMQCCSRVGLVCDDGRVVATITKTFEYRVDIEDVPRLYSYADWQHAKDAVEKHVDAAQTCSKEIK